MSIVEHIKELIKSVDEQTSAGYMFVVSCKIYHHLLLNDLITQKNNNSYLFDHLIKPYEYMRDNEIFYGNKTELDQAVKNNKLK